MEMYGWRAGPGRGGATAATARQLPFHCERALSFILYLFSSDDKGVFRFLLSYIHHFLATVMVTCKLLDPPPERPRLSS